MAKRIFDCLFAVTLLLLVSLPVFICWLLAAIDTTSNGLFIQKRIGQYGHPFYIYKLKTMHDGKVTKIGTFLRKFKIDELPQLINILKGEMSVVGPRPDLPGYYDQLIGGDRNVLELRPGLTSLAAIKYRNEEELLAQQPDPDRYNDHIIFPDKVKMNLEYLEQRSFWYDVKIILLTLKSLFK